MRERQRRRRRGRQRWTTTTVAYEVRRSRESKEPAALVSADLDEGPEGSPEVGSHEAVHMLAHQMRIAAAETAGLPLRRMRVVPAVFDDRRGAPLISDCETGVCSRRPRAQRTKRRPVVDTLVRAQPSQVLADMEEEEEQEEDAVFFLSGLGVSDMHLFRALQNRPRLRRLSVAKCVRPAVEFLVSQGITADELGAIVSANPLLVGLSVDYILAPTVQFLCEHLGLDPVAAVRVLAFNPLILQASHSTLENRVRFLVDAGVSPRALKTILRNNPTLLLKSISDDFTPVLQFLAQAGLSPSAVRSVIKRCPSLMFSTISDTLEPAIGFLHSVEVTDSALSTLLSRYPRLLCLSYAHDVRPKVKMLVELGLSMGDIGLMVRRYPYLFSLPIERLREPVDHLHAIGIRGTALVRFITCSPRVLSLPVHSDLIPKYKFLLAMCGSADDLNKFPNYLVYPLKARIVPRFLFILTKRRTYGLRQLIDATDGTFAVKVAQSTLEEYLAFRERFDKAWANGQMRSFFDEVAGAYADELKTWLIGTGLAGYSAKNVNDPDVISRSTWKNHLD